MSYSADVPEAFLRDAGPAMCRRLGQDPVDGWLYWLGLMVYESNISPGALSHVGSSAIGLIQFMRDTRRNLGWHGTDAEFIGLGHLGQLAYVEAYARPWFHQQGVPTSLRQTYGVVFCPAFMAKCIDPEFVIYDDATERFARAYRDNANLDEDGDRKIQARELETAVRRGIATLRWLDLLDRLKYPTLPSWVMPDDGDLHTTWGVQSALLRLGLLREQKSGWQTTKTTQALVAFQRAQHLVPDGRVGPKTRAALALAIT